jgi:hypothetical protein
MVAEARVRGGLATRGPDAPDSAVQVDLRTPDDLYSALEREAALLSGVRPSAARSRAVATLVKTAHEISSAEQLAAFERRLNELESETEQETR